MKLIIIFFAFLFSSASLFGCSSDNKEKEEPGNETVEAVKVIFDTDMCFDVDDVGALAILHAYADKGEAQIVAICYNEVHKDGVAAIDAINTWYGRGNIPIGIYKKPLSEPDHSSYLTDVAAFPNDIPADKSKIPSALYTYIDALSSQPDNSVVIISVGFLNNLRELLDNDKELVRRKVKKLVVMGGINNDDFNFIRHNLVSDTEKVLRDWPTPIVITQLGGNVLTGECLKNASDNPVKEAYYKWFGDKFEGRSSWDAYAVLYAIRGTDLFKEEYTGSGSLKNGYSFDMEKGYRYYITSALSDAEYKYIIEEMMMRMPKHLINN